MHSKWMGSDPGFDVLRKGTLACGDQTTNSVIDRQIALPAEPQSSCLKYKLAAITLKSVWISVITKAFCVYLLKIQ